MTNERSSGTRADGLPFLRRVGGLACASLVALAAFGGGVSVLAQTAEEPDIEAPDIEAPEDPAVVDVETPSTLLGSLKGKAPAGPNLAGVVRDAEWAVKLGKALFWDMQVGSDGVACASCHFHAGADSRVVNQLSPGILAGDMEFGAIAPARKLGRMAGGGMAGANIELTADDFPFHKLVDPTDRNSRVTYDSNDVVSSAGTFAGDALGLNDGRPRRTQTPGEDCGEPDATVFNSPTFAARKVEPRNTPTTINAAFNFRNFWDGRANNVFNGVDPFGLRTEKSDKLARLLQVGPDGFTVAATELRNAAGEPLVDASLASQAVGPPLSDFEMSCAGKGFATLGRKMLGVVPLKNQLVAADDSVLGPMRRLGGFGLKQGYAAMIRKAFEPSWWDASGAYSIVAGGDGEAEALYDPNGFSLMEHNFSMFWGVAVMLYEQTLISDDTPFDRWVEAGGLETMPAMDSLSAVAVDGFGEEEKRGLSVFLNEGKCVACHSGPDFTHAGMHLSGEAAEEGLVERMLMADEQNGPALYDNGFYNIGVRPTAEDPGVGGTDPFGNPLSFTRQYVSTLLREDVPDAFEVDECKFEQRFFLREFPSGRVKLVACPPGDVSVDRGDTIRPRKRSEILGLRQSVDGAFKTPGLRNVGLTAPYFHNGGQASLEQLIDFYDRGGDRRGDCVDGQLDTTATDGHCNLAPDITSLGLTAQQKQDLAKFLLSLTDQRVACESAPFDHPSLNISNGHMDWDRNGDGRAEDDVLELPSVGAAGRDSDACLVNSGDLFGPTQVVEEDRPVSRTGR